MYVCVQCDNRSWAAEPQSLTPSLLCLLCSSHTCHHAHPPSPLFYTHTHTDARPSCSPPTHLVHTCKPSIPLSRSHSHTCHTHTHTAPALLPTRPLRLGWLHRCLSVVTDECVRSISSRLGAHFQDGCKTIQEATR